ncbi:MAG: hypothetical protein ACREVI_13090 [Steroidobacteraceae bacterium]
MHLSMVAPHHSLNQQEQPVGCLLSAGMIKNFIVWHLASGLSLTPSTSS